MDDLQASEPVVSEGVIDAPAPEETSEQPEQKAEPKAKAEPKPKSEREKRRESLEKAFKKVEDDEEGEKQANGSPSTPKADPKAAEDTKAAKEEGPKRSADGKFAAKEAEKPDAKAAESAEDGQEAKEAPKTPSKVAEPPARFSAEAKAAWKDAPESVRGEAQRAVRELEHGLQQKDQQLRPLEPFIKMAREQGTTVDAALRNYVGMEQMLRKDPRQGLMTLAQNMGMTPQQMAGYLTGQPQQKGQQDPRDQQIIALTQQVRQMQQQFGQVNGTIQEQRQQAVLNQVQQFAADKPRFDELAPEIARMIETGYASDLSDAYEKADRMNPAPAPVPQPTAAPAPPAQTRPARSVTGAPTAGSNPGTRKSSQTRTEALSRAFRSAGLA